MIYFTEGDYENPFDDKEDDFFDVMKKIFKGRKIAIDWRWFWGAVIVCLIYNIALMRG